MFWKPKKAKCLCEVCKKSFSAHDVMPIRNLGFYMVETLKKLIPDYDANGYVCKADLRKMRYVQVQTLFAQHHVQGKNLEQIFLTEDSDHPFSFNQAFKSGTSVAEIWTQKITPMIGSWGFVIGFLIFISIWLALNIQTGIDHHFDPYPFNLLNVILSCMAAVQAPLILMAQNLLVKRDRVRADEEYFMDLKSELEIRQINDKLDALLNGKKNGHS